jgi:class 3 adenylate cyclase
MRGRRASHPVALGTGLAPGDGAKLVAGLSADVRGYNRLMGEDELTMIRTLTAYRDAMTALITQHRGRVVDAPGSPFTHSAGHAFPVWHSALVQ